MSRLSVPGAFVFLAVVWGLSFPAIAIGLEYLPPLLFAALRYDVAAVLLLVYAVFATNDWRPTQEDAIALVGGGVFLVAGNGLLFVGQQTVPSGVAAIMQALGPIVTALWALVLLEERLSALGAAGVAVGFLGIGFVVQPTPENLLSGDTIGRLLILVQVVSVALGGVLIQRSSPTVGRAAFTGWSMLLGAAVLHMGSLVARETPTASAFEPIAIGAVVYLGVFSTAIAFFMYFTVLEQRGAFEASLVTYLVPIVATVAGVFVLGEQIGVLTFIGFALVFAGFALLKRRALGTLLV